jgi:hypothetical protein
MADGTSTATVSFGKCPACQLSITATIAYATTLGSNSFSNEVVTATLKPVGVYLQHECKDGRVVPVARRRTPGWTPEHEAHCERLTIAHPRPEEGS